MAMLPYRRRTPVHAALESESRRRAKWLFIGAGVFFTIGTCLICLSPILILLGQKALLQSMTRSSSSRGTTRLLVSIGFVGFVVCGVAIRMFNAACYHRSCFEHRKRDGE